MTILSVIRDHERVRDRGVPYRSGVCLCFVCAIVASAASNVVLLQFFCMCTVLVEVADVVRLFVSMITKGKDTEY